MYKNIDRQDKNYLPRAIKEVEEAFECEVTIHDFQGILCGNDGTPLFPGRNVHKADYCFTGRHTNPGWSRNCERDCHHECDALSASSCRPFVKNCWKGVSELVVPIERDGVLKIILFAGVFRAYGSASASFRSELPEYFQKAYDGLPKLTEQKIAVLERQLYILGEAVLSHVDKISKISIQPKNRKEKIMFFIYHHAHHDAKLADLANFLHLSVSRAGHAAKAIFGDSFQELLAKERVKRAKALLLTTDKSLEEICGLVGLGNVYYFNRLFKKYVGIPPGTFRKKSTTSSESSG